MHNNETRRCWRGWKYQGHQASSNPLRKQSASEGEPGRVALMGKTQIAVEKWDSLGSCGSRWGDWDIQHGSDRKVPAQRECGIWRRPRAAAGGELRGQLTGRNPAMCVPASSPSIIECDRPRACFLHAKRRQLRREAGERVGEGLRGGTRELATQFPPLFLATE